MTRHIIKADDPRAERAVAVHKYPAISSENDEPASASLEIRDTVRRCHALLQEATAEHIERLRAVETEILDLAVAMARKILRQEFQLSPQLYTAMLEELRALFPRNERVRLQCGSAAYKLLGDQPGLESQSITLLEEPTMEPWGLLFHVEEATLEAGIESQLKSLKEQLSE